MFCGKCGTQVTLGTKFCQSCGAPIATSEAQKHLQAASPFTDTTRQQPQDLQMQNAGSLSVENLQAMFLSREGRLNRKPFFWCSLILSIIEVFIGSFMEGIADGKLSTLLSMVFLYPEYCLYVRRLHDIGHDERLAILTVAISALLLISKDAHSEFAALMGIAVISISLYMVFKEGTHGPNEYGLDPLEWKH